jgi:PAS domain S-box-containing protein
MLRTHLPDLPSAPTLGQPAEAGPRLAVVVPAVLACWLGAFVLTGWALGNAAMARVLPGSTAMAINTAASFVMAGIALLLSQRSGAPAARARKALGGMLVALPGAILVQHVTGADLGIDWAGIHAAVGDGHAKPGRMAPNACVGFIAAGLLLLVPGGRGGRFRWWHLALALVPLLLGTSAFIGYVLKLETLYRIASFNQMAALTALGMAVTGAGLVSMAVQRLPASARLDDASRITMLAAALLSVFAVATGVTAFGMLRTSYEQAAAHNLWQTAQTSALSVSGMLQNNALLATSLASRPALSASLATLGATPDDAGAQAQLRREEQTYLALGFASVEVADATGRRLGAAGRLDARPPAATAELPAEGGGAWLLWRGRFSHRTERPVFDRGVQVGRLTLERDLPELHDFIQQAARTSRTGDIVLCARDGAHVQCLPSRFYADPLRVPMFRADGTPAFPVTRALHGEGGATAVKDARGIPVLAAYVPVPRTPLALVHKLDTQELYDPLRDNLAGLVLAVLGFVAAGTWLLRKWVEPVVRQISNERTRIAAILDQSGDAFLAVDRSGRVSDWNRQAQDLFGWPAHDAIGRDLRDLAGRQQPWVDKAVPAGDAPVVPMRMESAAIDRGGQAIPVEVSIAPFEGGGVQAASIFLRDLRPVQAARQELDKARLALGQAQKLDAIGKLTGGVAHDFNNVLQVVGSNLQLLQRQLGGEQRRLVDSALAAADRGAKLSTQLLAFARRQPLQPVTFDANRRVQDMGDLLRRSLGELVELETVLAAGLWPAQADPHQLENVLLNLAINARDAMPEGGKLTIETCNAVLDDGYAAKVDDVRPGQYVMLAVSDTGTGMPPEVAARAFEPFFTTKPEGKGTGLGLSMAYGFAKQSGGHIRIYSEPGHGTTVRLYLPRSQEAEAAQAPPSSAEPPVGGTETVLVVEDDPEVQEVALRMLQDLGYRTLCASNGEAALRVLQSHPQVDLLFTDVVMPGPLKSPEVARRARETVPGLAVLYTSGYTQNAIVHGGRLDPGVELLSKPYRLEQLARKVRKVLDARRPEAGAAAAAPAVPRVLLVEDEEALRTAAQELLALLGIPAVTAGSAEEAERLLQRHAFDVLVTDVSLPGMDGIQLALRAARRNPALKIVFATGYGAHAAIPADLRHHVLAKPYGVDELEAVLRR